METEPTKSTRFTAFLYPRPHQNPEFIRNSGFEAGMAGWQPRGNEDMPNHQIVEEQPFEGARCARIENSGYYYSDRFALPPAPKSPPGRCSAPPSCRRARAPR